MQHEIRFHRLVICQDSVYTTPGSISAWTGTTNVPVSWYQIGPPLPLTMKTPVLFRSVTEITPDGVWVGTKPEIVILDWSSGAKL